MFHNVDKMKPSTIKNPLVNWPLELPMQFRSRGSGSILANIRTDDATFLDILFRDSIDGWEDNETICMYDLDDDAQPDMVRLPYKQFKLLETIEKDQVKDLLEMVWSGEMILYEFKFAWIGVVKALRVFYPEVLQDKMLIQDSIEHWINPQFENISSELLHNKNWKI